jgi:aminoglycoside phosphotransferase (APT) family kinase protein
MPPLDAEAAGAALARAGVAVPASSLAIERRDDRWLARLPDGRLAWFPASESGRRGLETESRVLRLLAERCAFRVPRVLLSTAEFELRDQVPGAADPWGLFERVKADPAFARRIGRSLGLMLADQHTAFAAVDVAGWLLRRTAWPFPAGKVRAALPGVVEDHSLLASIDRVLDRYEELSVGEDDRVLVHGDLGLHNIAVDPETGEVAGLFDYGDAAWTDRHHDFRYLLFGPGEDAMLDAAIATYEPIAGRTIDRARVALLNAVSAISFLADRAGHPPGARPAGRTLAEDLAWVRDASDRALASGSAG